MCGLRAFFFFHLWQLMTPTTAFPTIRSLRAPTVPNSSSSSSASEPEADNGIKRLKVLCLHGYLSSGKLFKAQLQPLVVQASESSEFVFLDAPHRLGLQAREISRKKRRGAAEGDGELRAAGDAQTSAARPGSSGKFRWWYAGTVGEGDEEELVQYMGLRESLQAIADADKEHGGFDVVLGHSQGACLVVTIDALNSKPGEDVGGKHMPACCAAWNNSIFLFQDFYEALRRENALEGGTGDVAPDGTAAVGDDHGNHGAPCPPGQRVLLPHADLSIVVSGFQPRDFLFNKLFTAIEVDAAMRGLQQKSLHVFSHEDEIVPPEASIQAMALYDFPAMKVRNGDHDPPRDEDTVAHLARALHRHWMAKRAPPLLLEP
jgi:hypothetical protein